MKISIIAAMSPNHAIGFKGRLPWNIPEDLNHFKSLTLGHTIIMGRKTFESLPHGALPGRKNIVLSHKKQDIDGCDIFLSFDEALKSCAGDDDVFIIGGASVYKEALPFASHLYLTLVDKDPPHADAFFPSIDMTIWKETKKEKHDGFSFIEFIRVSLDRHCLRSHPRESPLSAADAL